jgi:hypothetical protein
MLDQRTSVREFLEKRRLVNKKNDFSAAERRSRLETSGLPRLMESVCDTINREAGRVIVDGHSYMAPQPLVNCFTFIRHDMEYVMQLELHGANPILVFVARKWRDGSANSFIRWFVRLILPVASESIVHTCQVEENCVSEQDVKAWFFYLLSGLRRRFLPHPRGKDTLTMDEFRDAMPSSAGETCS